MKYLILSDIHANLEAFRAVLSHAARKRRDAVLFLGDVVGYGAAPNQVVERLRRMGNVVSVRGNHDRVVLDPEQGAVFFNTHARRAAQWSAEMLTPANQRYVEGLPIGPRTVGEGVAICHGSPSDEDEYLFSEAEAMSAFHAAPARVTFFGHSHVPCMFELSGEGDHESLVGVLLRGSRVVIDLDPTRRYLINPGSVGQPRDRDPRASYGMYDTAVGRFTLYRVPYNVELARRRILTAGLPPILGDRLVHGT
ncbi:MAG TPA: metallophosphoesterase family protein [Thermoanaerobaculaceae bacterium]|nr:metallophosphoesterase family protein [Thermoanaerobaculaceae bacterium]